jgi:hypothetical protein
MLEDIFALPRLPGALVQWTPPDGRGFSTTLTWSCPHGSSPAREGSRIFLRPGSEGGGHTVFRVEPEPRSWTVESCNGSWELSARVEVPPGETLTWIVGSAPKRTIAEAAARAMDAVRPQEAMQAGWLQELGNEHLRTRTGIHEIDSALEWAKARASGHDRPSLPRIIAQLGSGLLREAGATLDGLAETPSRDFGTALAEYLLWSGDYGAPARYRTHLAEWIKAEEVSPASLDPARNSGTADHHASEHTRLIEALESLGYPEESAAVKAHTLARASRRPSTGALALPMTGQNPPPPAPVEPQLVWLRFRELTAACATGAIIRSDDSTVGSSKRHYLDPCYGLLRILLEEILHLSGEASLGRLQLAPSLPEHLLSFQIEGLRVGKGGIDFRMDHDGDWVRYLFQPTTGAMPLNLIFEPALNGVALAEARVDGGPAELDWGMGGKRITPRIQLPVDRERTVELRIERDESG